MPVAIIYRTDGPWGIGLGVDLDGPQVDSNFYSVEQAIEALEADRPQPNNIASITVSGTVMTIFLDDGTEIGPLQLPILQFRDRGEWTPLTPYAALDVFTVQGDGLYSVLVNHTSAANFDGDAGSGTPEAAGTFVVDLRYRIETIGDTDFTLCGAAANTVGLAFIATAAGSGTGTASRTIYNKLIGIEVSSSTMLGDLLDVTIASPADGDALVYDAGTGEWVNRAGGAGVSELDDLSDVVLTSPTASQVLTFNGTDWVNGDAAATGLPTIAAGSVLGNPGASSAVAAGATLSSIIDRALGSTRGQLLYRGAAAWSVIAPGTAGQQLTTGGAGADPSWAAPVDSAALDAVLGSTQGQIAYRNATIWTVLPPGIAGEVLATGGGAANPHWASPNAGVVNSGALDAAFGNTQGNILYRNATAWVVLAPGTAGQFLKTGGGAANLSWDTPAGGGGGSGGGLFNQVLSPTPTIANTGLNTWLAQGGASVADVATGMSLTSPSTGGSTQLRGRTKAAPATPYAITALLAANCLNVNYVWPGFGWYDGTNKLHVLEYYRSLSNPWSIDVRQWSSPTSPGTVEAGSVIDGMYPSGMVWLRLRDNGTTVFFEWSVDGSNFITLFSVAKGSGYLGSSGYSNIVLFVNAQTTTQPVTATLLSYAQA